MLWPYYQTQKRFHKIKIPPRNQDRDFFMILHVALLLLWISLAAVDVVAEADFAGHMGFSFQNYICFLLW